MNARVFAGSWGPGARARLVTALVCASALCSCAPNGRRDASTLEATAATSDALDGGASSDQGAGETSTRDEGAVPLDALDATVSIDVSDANETNETNETSETSDASDGEIPSDASDTGALGDALGDAAGDAPGDAPGDASIYSSACGRYVRTLGDDETIEGHAFGPSRESGNGCTPSSPGPEEYFALYNATPSRWFFRTDDPRTSAQTTITVRPDCADPRTELGCADDGVAMGGRTNFSIYIRPTRGFAVVLDRQDGEGPYDYVFRARRVSIAPHAVCTVGFGTVIAADGARVAGENLEQGYRGDTGFCVTQLFAPQLFYRLTIPAMRQVTVTATPTAPASTSWRPRLRVTSQCEMGCLAFNTAGAAGEAGSVVAVNNSETPRSVFVSVASDSENVFGSYTLTTRAAELQQGYSCELPEPLVVGTTLTAKSTLDAGAQSSACGVASSGQPDGGAHRHYTVRVAPGRRVRVTVTPRGTPWTALLWRYRGCPVSTCLGASSSGAPGDAVRVLFENAGDRERTYAFSIAARDGGAHEYDLTSELVAGVIPYVESTVPASCDTLTGDETLRATAAVDEGATDALPLPFTFTLFGQSYSHYAISSNGFVQLLDDVSMRGSIAPRTLALPDPMAPRALLAPYWADLSARFPAGEVRSGALRDAAGTRFVTHWSSFTLERDATTLLSFQLKLFEASRAIEFHWCTLSEAMTASRVRGSAATVGLQDAAGIEAITFARNAQGALDPTVAVRYAPRP